MKLELRLEFIYLFGWFMLGVWSDKMILMLNSTQVDVIVDVEVEPGKKNVCQHCIIYYDILIPDTYSAISEQCYSSVHRASKYR